MQLPGKRPIQKIVVHACTNKQFTFSQSLKIIESQQSGCNSTDIRKGRHFGAIETKVRPPYIDSSIEKRCQPLGLWFDRRNIAALTKIADHARPSEIPKFGRIAMLAGNVMVELVNGQRGSFGNQTILASSKGPILHQGPYAVGASHHAAPTATLAFTKRTTCSSISKDSNSLSCTGASLPSRFSWINSFSLACSDEGSRNARIWLPSLPASRKSNKLSYSIFCAEVGTAKSVVDPIAKRPSSSIFDSDLKGK